MSEHRADDAPQAAPPPLLLIDGSPASARQQGRYALVLESALSRVREVGFDQTRMQDISEASGVAMATIYRYFGSRDKLLYVATNQWLNDITSQSLPSFAKRRLEGRLIGLVRTSARILGEQPRLLEAWARSNLSNEPDVVALVRERRLLDSLGMFPLEQLTDRTLLNDLNLMMEHVWFSGIVRWAHGQKDYGDVSADVERAMLMVLNAHRSSPDLQQSGTQRR